MNQVHWPLFALSFFVGLVFTFALLARPAKRRAPVRRPSGGSHPTPRKPRKRKKPVPKEPPTTKIPVAEKSPKRKTPVKDAPTTKIRVAKDARTTKIPVTEKTTKIPVTEANTKIPVDASRRIKMVPYAPYGPGSARADADGNGPSDWMVKGRSDTRLYYTPDDRAYDQTVAQVWFKDEDSAARALFTPWRNSSRK